MVDEAENTEVVETPAADASAAVVDAPVTETPEQSEPEALKHAAAAGKAEAAATDGEAAEPAAIEYKPVVKFKAGVFNRETKSLEQKEYDIDPKFHGIMKDAESEKLVRELHEKAFGLDSVKQRFDLTKNELQEVVSESRSLKSDIDGLRNTYQSAVKSGNWHKLDSFFERLQIPQQHILNYALAKVQLAEAPPEQQNAIMGQLQAERQAEQFAQQQAQLQGQTIQQQQQIKTMLLEHTLDRVEVAPLAKAFDERTGRPDSFKELVRREGEAAWYREGVDLTPEQAVKRVIENYGLANGTHGLPPEKQNSQSTTQAPAAQTQTIVKRQATTIPNIQGRSTSPLQAKPKSVDDILKHRKEVHGF